MYFRASHAFPDISISLRPADSTYTYGDACVRVYIDVLLFPSIDDGISSALELFNRSLVARSLTFFFRFNCLYTNASVSATT